MQLEFSTIDTGRYHFEEGHRFQRGFTLIEMLVVMAIIALLCSIIVPVVGKAKRQAISILGGNNQRQVVGGVNLYAMDNNDMYPESVATVGEEPTWNWSDPRKMIGNDQEHPTMHRAMSEYLGDYIENASVMYCPNAPRKYKYLQESWEAGDDWDNPGQNFPLDPVTGTYCFYWNYIGVLEDRPYPFKGPRDSTGRRRQSKLVVSDYFGFDHRRSPDSFGSCERFKGSSQIGETFLLSSFWSGSTGKSLDNIEIQLRAGFTDGHVETYSATEVTLMKISITPDGTIPYPKELGMGDFYLPKSGLMN